VPQFRPAVLRRSSSASSSVIRCARATRHGDGDACSIAEREAAEHRVSTQMRIPTTSTPYPSARRNATLPSSLAILRLPNGQLVGQPSRHDPSGGDGRVLSTPRGARRAVPPRTGQFSKGVDADETLPLTRFFRSLLGLAQAF